MKKSKKAEEGLMSNYVVWAIVVFIMLLVTYFVVNQGNIFKSMLGLN